MPLNVVKDITKVSSANIIGLFSSVVTGFLVPAFLSLEQYAYLKTFALVLSFAGILHFGYIDGIYIKYGGKYSSEIDNRMIKTEKSFFILFQLLIAVLIFIAGLVFNEIVIMALAAAMLPYNLLSYYQSYYQAIGQFGIYTKIKLIVPLAIMIFSLVLIYILKLSNFVYFISAEIIAYLITVIYLEFKYFFKIRSYGLRQNIRKILHNFNIGLYIMTGNLAMILFYTLGRWIVKIFMSDADFAYYSFATSMMQILTIVISSIAMTFYPYLSRIHEKKDLARLKIQLIIIGAFFSFSYFIFNLAVNTFIPKYAFSLKIIGILFASFPAFAVIQALYVNMYKIQKNGQKYVAVIFLNLIVAFVLSISALFINKSTISIAIASTVTYYFWMYYSSKDFSGLISTAKEVLFIFFYLLIYFAGVFFFSPLLALIFSLSLLSLLSCMYLVEMQELLRKALSIIKNE